MILDKQGMPYGFARLPLNLVFSTFNMCEKKHNFMYVYQFFSAHSISS